MPDVASTPARSRALGDLVSARTLGALAKLKQLHPDERQVVKLLGISRSTYARALAQLGLRRGSIVLIESRLQALGMYEGRGR
jgi:hypothetical protein